MDNTAYLIFRFEKLEIYTLLDYLELENVRYPARIQPSLELALCILLGGLATPLHLHQQQISYSRSASYISITFNCVAQHIEMRFGTLLDWHPSLTYERLSWYAEQLSERSLCADRIWGFIDGTFRRIAWLIRDQEAFYNGYYKSHGFKAQGIITPDGLILSLGGPYVGRLHDSTLWRRVNIEERLWRLYEGQAPLYLYGDSAYSGLYRVITPFQRY